MICIMGEASIVQNSSRLCARASLAQDLRRLGLKPGLTLIVHSSLSSLGWVCGGPVAVVQALMDVLTPAGTLVMPTQTGNNSDPANWNHPPVPQEWWQPIREETPAFDPQISPTRGMGVIVEAFRTFPGIIRSNHPTVSFAAWGQRAQRIIADHQLAYGLGESSPLARIYEMGGWILLLGVGYDSCTSLHLAEYRTPPREPVQLGSALFEDGKRIWKTYDDIEIDSGIFPEIGTAFEMEHSIQLGKVGSADARLLPQRDLIDFAVDWYTRFR